MEFLTLSENTPYHWLREELTYLHTKCVFSDDISVCLNFPVKARMGFDDENLMRFKVGFKQTYEAMNAE